MAIIRAYAGIPSAASSVEAEAPGRSSLAEYGQVSLSESRPLAFELKGRQPAIRQVDCSLDAGADFGPLLEA